MTPGLAIASSATIHGALEYVGPVEAEIGGAVQGSVTYHSTTPAIIPITPEHDLSRLLLEQFKREIAALLTVGLLGTIIAPKQFRSPLSNLRKRPASSFVIGMLLFILSFPIALIMILITAIIVLLLALLQLDGVLLVIGSLLTLIDLSVIGIFYFTAILVARAIFAIGIGQLVLRIALGREMARQMPRMSLLAGVILLAILASLPEVGFLFNALALFMGLGAIAGAVADWITHFVETRMSAYRPPLWTIAQSFPSRSQTGTSKKRCRQPVAVRPRSCRPFLNRWDSMICLRDSIPTTFFPTLSDTADVPVGKRCFYALQLRNVRLNWLCSCCEADDSLRHLKKIGANDHIA